MKSDYEVTIEQHEKLIANLRQQLAERTVRIDLNKNWSNTMNDKYFICDCYYRYIELTWKFCPVCGSPIEWEGVTK